MLTKYAIFIKNRSIAKPEILLQFKTTFFYFDIL